MQGNNKQNGSPQNAGGVQQNPGALAPNAIWQQPNYGSQPPPGFVEQSHHAAPPPSFGQQQGPAWQQPPRPGNPARPEPTKQGAWQQNGYTSAPRNVFGETVPTTGAPAAKVPLHGPQHARQPHAKWPAQQPQPSAHNPAMNARNGGAQLMGNQYTGSAIRPAYPSAGTGAGRPGVAMPAARPGNALGGAPLAARPPAAARAGGALPGQQAASSAQLQLPAGGSSVVAAGQRLYPMAGHGAGNAMPAAQPLPLNMHSPVRGAAPAPTSTPPTNSLRAHQSLLRLSLEACLKQLCKRCNIESLSRAMLVIHRRQ